MKAITFLLFIFLCISVNAQPQGTKRKPSYEAFEQANKNLKVENDRLNKEINLYKQLTNQLDELVEIYEDELKIGKEKPVLPKSEHYHTFGYRQKIIFDKDIFIKGNIWVIDKCDTVLLYKKGYHLNPIIK